MKVYLSISSSKEEKDPATFQSSSFNVTFPDLSSTINIPILYGAMICYLQGEQFIKGLDTLNENILKIKEEIKKKK